MPRPLPLLRRKSRPSWGNMPGAGARKRALARVYRGTVRAPARMWRASSAHEPREKAMCLGVPGRVVEVRGQVAIVDFWGVKRETRLDVVDEPVQPGDWILNHVGYA